MKLILRKQPASSWYLPCQIRIYEMERSEYLLSQQGNFPEFGENWSTMSLNHSSCFCPLKSDELYILLKKKKSPYLTFISFTKRHNLKSWYYFSLKYLSFSRNFLKSFAGGLRIRPIQEHRESSSEPNPV